MSTTLNLSISHTHIDRCTGTQIYCTLLLSRQFALNAIQGLGSYVFVLFWVFTQRWDQLQKSVDLDTRCLLDLDLFLRVYYHEMAWKWVYDKKCLKTKTIWQQHEFWKNVANLHMSKPSLLFLKIVVEFNFLFFRTRVWVCFAVEGCIHTYTYIKNVCICLHVCI